MRPAAAGRNDRRDAVDACLRQLLIVGGNSNAAKAFRRRISAGGHFRLRTLVRNEVDILPGENIVLVQDYFTPVPGSLEHIDVVINFARVVNATEEELYHANASGPTRLATAARAAGVRHFLHISSVSVYGGAEDIAASTPPAPTSLYGKSMPAGDQALAELSSPIFGVTSLRVPILYNVSSRSKLHKLAKALTWLHFFRFRVSRSRDQFCIMTISRRLSKLYWTIKSGECVLLPTHSPLRSPASPTELRAMRGAGPDFIFCPNGCVDWHGNWGAIFTQAFTPEAW